MFKTNFDGKIEASEGGYLWLQKRSIFSQVIKIQAIYGYKKNEVCLVK